VLLSSLGQPRDAFKTLTPQPRIHQGLSRPRTRAGPLAPQFLANTSAWQTLGAYDLGGGPYDRRR
jgi:hypothetical protein